MVVVPPYKHRLVKVDKEQGGLEDAVLASCHCHAGVIAISSITVMVVLGRWCCVPSEGYVLGGDHLRPYHRHR